MKAQKILGSPPFIMLGVAIARLTPKRFGYWLARRVAQDMSRRCNHLFSTLRANLRHVVGSQASEQDLNRLAENAIYHAGCTYFDMFRARRQDIRQGRVTVRIDPEAWALAKSVLSDQRGAVLVGPHMSNFDLAAQWITAQGIQMQALSLATPDLGTRVVNWLRERRGMTMTPIDVRSLRLALERLRQGGVVLTGVDRPVSKDDEPILFFDAPARMPSGHVRLAIQTSARIVVACCVQEPDGYYSLRLAPPLEMEISGDRAQDVHHNTRRVLAVIEDMIRQAPDQWLMFVPVWPEGDMR